MARRLGVALLAGLCAACGGAAYASGDFGLAPLAREAFPALDSALADRVGQPLLVHAQRNLGQAGPVAAGEIGFRRFDGQLLGVDSGWVSLFRAPRDTVRVSKGHITAIWRAEAPPRGRSSLFGAAILALSAAALIEIQPSAQRPTAQNQLVIVGGAALLGGVIGRLLFSSPRRGEQLYPPARRDR